MLCILFYYIAASYISFKARKKVLLGVKYFPTTLQVNNRVIKY